jgi:hypothetical protein
MYLELANRLLDTIRNEVKPAGALSQFRAFYCGEMDQNTTLERPYVVVFLEDPALFEAWKASGNTKDGTLAFRVEAITRQAKQSRDYPWGVPGNPDTFGAIEALEVLGDFLDTKRNIILGADARAFELNISGKVNRGIGGDTLVAALAVEIKARFKAGERRP